MSSIEGKPFERQFHCIAQIAALFVSLLYISFYSRIIPRPSTKLSTLNILFFCTPTIGTKKDWAPVFYCCYTYFSWLSITMGPHQSILFSIVMLIPDISRLRRGKLILENSSKILEKSLKKASSHGRIFCTTSHCDY